MLSDEEMFRKAYEFAKNNSTCIKVAVGAALDDNNGNIIVSCNMGEHNCKEYNECYKAKVTGVYESVEWTRKYCQAIHAEINMINILKNSPVSEEIYNNPLYVTRYPCLNCAKKIAERGFKFVKYSGKQEISNEVKKIFDKNNIKYEWFPQYDFEF